VPSPGTESPRPAAAVASSDPEATGRAVGLAVLAWLIPGAAHLVLGQLTKAVVFAVVLTGMFVIGCAFDGRLFPFQWSEWMVLLPAIAEWGVGLPRMIAGMGGFGVGEVTSITYEYGNTFLMTAGLLNALVALNAFDLARGRARS
jgi:hypothetical protein